MLNKVGVDKWCFRGLIGKGLSMALIRALTLHVAPRNWSPHDIVDSVIELVSKVRDCIRTCGLNVWTLRAILPPLPASLDREWCQRLARMLASIDDILIAAFPLECESPCTDIILELIDNAHNIYGSIRCDSDTCLLRAVNKTLKKSVEPDTYTRFAITVGTWIETPYFPAAANVSMSMGISASLRYVDLVERALLHGDVEKLTEFIESSIRKLHSVALCSELPFRGIDLSLSPWMDESVGHLIEKLISAKIGSPGTINAVHSLNMFIKAIARKMRLNVIGFNEVMLSVAEDNILNERVKEGYVRLRDLVCYSLFCAPGLDMVAIPRSIDLDRLAIDVFTVHKYKMRTLIIRVIPVDAEPGTPIQLKNIGTTYVSLP
ncbi:MAG TPA: DUF711 family protein [Ignisphaera sp.]|nr:DUF711 family protein [Ignisphaera sp.]